MVEKKLLGLGSSSNFSLELKLMWRDSLTANEPFRLGLKILIVNLFKMVTSRVNVLNFWQIDSQISAFWIFMNFVAFLVEKTWNCFDGQLDWLCRSIKANFNIWGVLDRWHLENWRNYICAGIHVGSEINWKFETKRGAENWKQFFLNVAEKV